MLNITPDHLERHGTMQKYVAAKSKIFARQTEHDIFVYNADDDKIRGLLGGVVAEKVPFSIIKPEREGAYISSGFACFTGEPIVALDELRFKGRELENVLAAIATTMSLGVSPYAISKAASSFNPDAYRRQLVKNEDGISVFNDSKATNVYSCLSACEAMDGDFVLIVGGARREEKFDELFAQIPTTLKHIVVCGENKTEILSSAYEAGFESIEVAVDLRRAYSSAYAFAKVHHAQNILFSPASKSFDSYKNYEERGRAFDDVVKSFHVK